MRRWSRPIIVALSLVLGLPGVAFSAVGNPDMFSSSYGVVESEVGGNGCTDTLATGYTCGSSTTYGLNPGVDNGGSTLGESAVGNSSSTSYQTNAGFDTTAEPGLIITLNNSSAALGVLSTSAAKFATATFDVRDYTSWGYVVQVVGTAPTSAGHALSSLATDTASSAGTEQFGLNTVQNTVAGFGANPVQLPSAAFADGVSGDGATGTYGTTRPYTISDKYRFNSGDTIASAPNTSGDTKYTITFMANMSNTTPAGTYTSNLSIVATGSY